MAETLGAFGERSAAAWYVNNGYRLLATNWRCREGELDLVVTADDAVVFVEVKTRSTARYGTGAEAVDWRKQQRVRTVAGRWLASQCRHYPELRFDVVDVNRRGELQVHQGCF